MFSSRGVLRRLAGVLSAGFDAKFWMPSRLAGSISQHLSFIYQVSTPPKKKMSLVHILNFPQLTWFHYVILRRWTFWKIPINKKKNTHTKMSQQKCPTPRIFPTFGKSPRFPSCNPFPPSALLRRARKGGCSSKSVLAKDVCTKTSSVSVGCWLGWSCFSGFWGASLKQKDSQNRCLKKMTRWLMRYITIYNCSSSIAMWLS